MQKIVIVDYGMGNLHSVSKALKKVAKHRDFLEVSSEIKTIELADTIVFPGVGAAGAAMDRLKLYNLIEVLQQSLKTKKFLGICLGMQVLFERSDEDITSPTLGHFVGEIVKFDYAQLNKNSTDYKIKVPHMGWNSVQVEKPHKLWDTSTKDFYFVHSYYAPLELKNQFDSILTTEYAGKKFISALIKDRVVATQFHPEKSSTAGLEFLENFVSW